MIRSVLAFLLCAGVIALGLATAFVQVRNCRRAQRLAALQREIEMLEAGAEQLEARCAAWSLDAVEVPTVEVDA